MALKFSYADIYGVTHSDAYLMIDEITLKQDNVTVLYSVYHNTTARSKSTPANQKIAVISNWLTIDGSTFTTWFAETVLDDANKTPAKQAYTYLKTLSDVPNAGGSASGIDLTSATDV